MRHPQADRFPELCPFGMDGFLVRFALGFSEQANRAARDFGAEAARLPGVCEVVPALASVQIRLDLAQVDRAQGAAALRGLIRERDWLDRAEVRAQRCWHLPISFDGDDAPGLAQAAAKTGLGEAAAVAQILDARPRILAIGFAPGQPYLGLLPRPWDFPRRDSLADVPAGALTVAIRQLVLFANPSPTGWLQIARTAFRPFQPEADDPMPLRPGDMIRFHRISAAERLTLAESGDMGGARLEYLT
ncbi:5-oxoprolinase subunit B family protein [Pseudooceanicola algae]|uniref:5-oxoprolinase subunit B n=1 Tax=Pseudooceanicola algae TaxID=1537215 RepID=A0A418SH96_9RHOB|nr:carboxyltransferase domain-containing protein [Pseudooceanicola algae]QPM90418.1 5-oxoprolinase subunit B [Pseudooceanicola algae]